MRTLLAIAIALLGPALLAAAPSTLVEPGDAAVVLLERRAGVKTETSIEIVPATVVRPAVRIASSLLTRDVLLLDGRRNI